MGSIEASCRPDTAVKIAGADVHDVNPASSELPSTGRARPTVIPPDPTTCANSPEQSPRRRRPLARVAVALAASGALAFTVSPASAVPTDDDSAGTALADYSGAQDHYAGSQIAAHEGVHGSPQAGQFALANQTLGHDVSGHQGAVDWDGASSSGAKFVYVKATEGTSYTSPQFSQQYNGSYDAGMIRGAYHFALPDRSSGAEQANYFVDHGGGWSADGKTLPGALDAEYNPYGSTCYGKSQAGMTAWIKDFSDTYHARTGRYPMIYTSTNWWTQCTGNSGDFGATNPLWLASYNDSVGELPNGWSAQSLWQFADSGTLPGDQNYFNGAQDRLQALADG